MPNRVEHLVFGALTSSGLYVGYKFLKGETPTLLGLASAGALGAGTAALPDLLEPPVSPNHRAGFHSWLALGLLAAASAATAKSEISEMAKIGILSVAGGYGSHLLADAMTPKGLPFAPR